MFDILPGDKGFLHPELAGDPVFKRYNTRGRQTAFSYYCVVPKKPILVEVASVRLWVCTMPRAYWDNVESGKPMVKEVIGVIFLSPDGPFSWEVLADDFIPEWRV